MRVLDRYHRLQRVLGIPECHCVTAYDIQAITTDSCNEMAGAHAGAAALLELKRRECYDRLKEQGVKLGVFQPLERVPCALHVAAIMAAHMSKKQRDYHDEMVAEGSINSSLAKHFLSCRNGFESLAFCIARWLFHVSKQLHAPSCVP